MSIQKIRAVIKQNYKYDELKIQMVSYDIVYLALTQVRKWDLQICFLWIQSKQSYVVTYVGLS